MHDPQAADRQPFHQWAEVVDGVVEVVHTGRREQRASLALDLCRRPSAVGRIQLLLVVPFQAVEHSDAFKISPSKRFVQLEGQVLLAMCNVEVAEVLPI
jgi:hypothetical protein